MKTKFILLIALVAILFSFASVGNETQQTKTISKNSIQTEAQIKKGLAMEDKDQFN